MPIDSDEQRRPVVADEVEDVVERLLERLAEPSDQVEAGDGAGDVRDEEPGDAHAGGAGEQAERVVRGDEDERVRGLPKQPSHCRITWPKVFVRCSIHVMAVSPYQ